MGYLTRLVDKVKRRLKAMLLRLRKTVMDVSSCKTYKKTAFLKLFYTVLLTYEF
jgi:hypothetical protein